MSLSAHVDSNTYFKVVKHDSGRKVIQFKIYTLDSSQTWETTLLPKEKIDIGCKWIFKVG